ncbi:hypothetical protein B9T11_08640 [Wohlfahrtiimonas chitiniclastica]|uniref:hypothetical protein n=1 Tax=Wohlfahrtiimonas chitiniclastica TaxID=400946 RepID=UPI000B98D951|nr:hypothetical protein [Wohlfahrtiimonas chitiniclastica]OYQ79292.1 hypothetical protein B9T11_08640 [Wohlfahrtiimonas chitiniclastica]
MTDLQKKAFTFLKNSYTNTTSVELKGNIALAIGDIGGDDAFTFLKNSYTNTTSIALKGNIALAIGKCS